MTSRRSAGPPRDVGAELVEENTNDRQDVRDASSASGTWMRPHIGDQRLALVAEGRVDTGSADRSDARSTETSNEVGQSPIFSATHPVRNPDIDAAVRHLLSRRDMAGLPDRIAVLGPRSGVGVSTIAESMAHVLSGDFDALVCHLDLSNVPPDEETDSVGSLRTALPLFDADAEIVFDRGDRDRVSALRLGAVSDDEWYGLVRSEEFASALTALGEMFDVVVVELPPLLEGSRSLSMMQHLESVVMVVSHGSTSIADVEAMRDEVHGSDVLGVVLNRYRSRVPRRLRRRLGIG